MINGALTVVLVFCALMLGGVVGAWAVWPTAYRHGYGEGESERHRHRRGDPQETALLQLPRAGRLEQLADPAPFPGESVRFVLCEDEIQTLAGPMPEARAPWLFAGEQDPGWAAEAAEYERPHQPEDRGHFTGVGANTTWHPSTTPEHVPGVDTPSDFTRRMALDMDMFIKNMVEQSNYDQHMMRAD